MRPDATSRTEADAAAYEAIRGHDEWIGGDVGDQEPNPLLVRTLGSDPWAPFTCPRCGDEDRSGMPEVCGCGWRNYGD